MTLSLVKTRPMPTKSVEELKAELEKVVQQEKDLREDIKLKQGLTIALCRNKNCRHGHEIRTLTYIQTHYYIAPHGCTGGDYWSPDEHGEWDCPDCKSRNRVYFQQELSKLKYSFAGIKEEHKD
jgi:hypothetical protein